MCFRVFDFKQRAIPILYRNAKLFFANISESSKDVLQYDDREEGKIIGKVTKENQSALQPAHLPWISRISVQKKAYKKNGNKPVFKYPH